MSKQNVFPILIPCFMIVLFTGCAENPADKTNPAETTVPFEATDASIEGTTYAFSPDTSVEFVGSKVTGSHDGGFKTVSGSVIVPDGDLSQAQINVNIDMTSLWSDKDKLTKHLNSEDFFEVDTYPETTFTSTSITASGEGFLVDGNLTLHGVTKGISFPAEISLSDDATTLYASAEFWLNRMDFGIAFKGKSDDLIRPEVVLRFNLEAVPAS